MVAQKRCKWQCWGHDLLEPAARVQPPKHPASSVVVRLDHSSAIVAHRELPVLVYDVGGTKLPGAEDPTFVPEG